MKLRVLQTGQGPALVILHGLFGTGDNWRTLALRWAPNFTVYAVDQRNHGLSPHSDTFDLPSMAADLLELLDDNGLATATVIGHSMGGKVAMQAALQHPDRITRLIVADMAPKAYPPGHSDLIAALLSVPLGQLQNRKDADDWLLPRIPDFAVRQFLLKGLYRTDDNRFAWRYNLPVIAGQYNNILIANTSDQPYPHPTLFVSGGRSSYVSAQDIEAAKGLFPQLTWETLPGVGHWVHAEAPDAFFDTVNRFLTTHG